MEIKIIKDILSICIGIISFITLFMAIYFQNYVLMILGFIIARVRLKELTNPNK